jgi:hypothetical protein
LLDTFPFSYKGNYYSKSLCNTLFYNETTRSFFINHMLHWRWRKTKKTAKKITLKNFKIVLDTFPFTYKINYRSKSVCNTLFYNKTLRLLFINHRLHWRWRNTQKTAKKLTLKICQIVLDFFPFIFKGSYRSKLVCNTLFYNKTIRLLFINHTLHWRWRKTKITAQNLTLKNFQIVLDTFFSLIKVIIALNWCVIPYSTIKP